MRQAVRAFHTAHPGAPIRYVHVIPTPTSLIVRQQRNEFGEPCVRAEPNIAPIVRAALSERGLTDRPRITVDRDGHWIEWGNRLHGFMLDSREVAPSDPAETVVVDMRDLVLY